MEQLVLGLHQYQLCFCSSSY
uniref:Uncharacterized protein n=1 Tax=Lepeophtheirus salmonis TaxID=72036 RepID=A0A0K2T8U1_LEPSM